MPISTVYQYDAHSDKSQLDEWIDATEKNWLADTMLTSSSAMAERPRELGEVEGLRFASISIDQHCRWTFSHEETL